MPQTSKTFRAILHLHIPSKGRRIDDLLGERLLEQFDVIVRIEEQ